MYIVPTLDQNLSLSLRQTDDLIDIFGMVGKNITNRPRYLTAIKLRKGENKYTDDGLTMF
jgi:hypothetical protein